jgi:hypothetical protein
MEVERTLFSIFTLVTPSHSKANIILGLINNGEFQKFRPSEAD